MEFCFRAEEAVEKLEEPLCSAVQPLLRNYERARGQPVTTNGRRGIANVRFDTQRVR
jgi:hypothetical protein